MKKCETLGEKAKQIRASTLPQPTVQTTVNLAPPPVRVDSTPPVATQAEPVHSVGLSRAPSTQAITLVQLPGDVQAAVAAFDNLYIGYLNITALDVWTGKSNDLVNEWGRFCQHQAGVISKATTLPLERESLNLLRSTVEKFNTFSTNLTQKIHSLQITDHQRKAIMAFGTEHDQALGIFRSNINSGNRALLDAQFRIIQNLDRNLRALNIDYHPSVVSHLLCSKDSLEKMADVFAQLDNKKHEPQEPVHSQPVTAQAGLSSSYEEPETNEQEMEYNLPPQKQSAPESTPPPAQQAPAGPKFCPECGNPNTGARFCGECGFQFGSY